ncbi:MAG TPA: MogA/MoaB family molybdenum cofactor biosynthesis protein [Chloroflexi bacterium]|jgi:molybdopterin adenylyltransferase|nr:MogA/MoaB family molybdenum cofactor biosynthesis protein [Chloroflexota bacterium]
MSIKAAVVTVSDKAHAGRREDRSGPLLVEWLRDTGFDVVVSTVVPDNREQIARLLCELADETGVDLVITTGGTGAAPRDVTPEATRDAMEREMPGLAELLRWEGYRRTPYAVLSRGVAGIRKGTLMVNLAGNPKAVREGIEILQPVLPHALQMLRGENLEHGTGSHEHHHHEH